MEGGITQERIRTVLAGLMAPLARTLLRCGVSYTEFAEIAKYAFVSAASEDYGVRNRPTNIARVAVMTGISRKEVGHIRRSSKRKRKPVLINLTLPARVLEMWYTKSKYTNAEGLPKALAVTGKSSGSFAHLVRCAAGDIPPGAMMRELARAGSIRVIGGDRVIAVKRHFIPDSATERLVIGLELGLRRLAETIALNSDYEPSGNGRFQRFIEGPPILKGSVGVIQASVKQVLTGLAVALDENLYKLVDDLPKQQRPTPKSRDLVRFGVGIYYFDDFKSS